MKRIGITLLVTLSLTACVSADGPTRFDVWASARQNGIPVVNVSEQADNALNPENPDRGLSAFGGRAYVPDIIKPGDTVAVSVFDTKETGLYSAAGSTSLALGEYTVAPSGTISLPFVGTINVAGRSTSSAAAIVTRKLRDSSVNPYATVNITRKDTDSFAVQGAVKSSGQFSLTARSERVLNAIAAAGGATGVPNETIVTLVRGGASGTQVLSEIMASPQDNVRLQPGDALVVGGGDASFIADGAVRSPGEFYFVEGDKTLAQAIAQAGGLVDSRANPEAVFVFRRLRLGETLVLPNKSGNELRLTGKVIFRVSYKSVGDRFRAGRFQMRDGDAIYVGNASLANFKKYFQIFSSPPEVPVPPTPRS
jgi:polysaccharide biosynthesis/export protein